MTYDGTERDRTRWVMKVVRRSGSRRRVATNPICRHRYGNGNSALEVLKENTRSDLL